MTGSRAPEAHACTWRPKAGPFPKKCQCNTNHWKCLPRSKGTRTPSAKGPRPLTPPPNSPDPNPIKSYGMRRTSKSDPRSTKANPQHPMDPLPTSCQTPQRPPEAPQSHTRGAGAGTRATYTILGLCFGWSVCIIIVQSGLLFIITEDSAKLTWYSASALGRSLHTAKV